jgi:hypothetical protein
VDRGDREGLTRRADAGSWSAAKRLAALLAARGDLEGLTRRADAGDDCAVYQLINLRGVPTIELTIPSGRLTLEKAKIAAEAKLDGKYLLSTSTRTCPPRTSPWATRTCSRPNAGSAT